MSQSDYIISDDSGAAVLADLSAAFQALASHNLGTTAPVTKYQGMTWIDSSASPWVFKRWDGADWITEGIIDPTGNVYIPYMGTLPANDDRYKNRIANGDMGLDTTKGSHATAASFTLTAGAARVNATDLWLVACTGANVTAQQVAGVGGHRAALRFTGAASVTGLTLCQRIEGAELLDVISSIMCLSANLSSTTLTTVTWKAYYANALNDFTTRTQFATGTFTINSVPTCYETGAITMHANSGNGVEIEFSVGAFTSGTFTITGVQLERGTSRSQFEMQDIVHQRQRCQRMYTLLDCAAQAPAIGYTLNQIPLPVEMRTTPSTANIAAGTASNATVSAEAATSSRSVEFQINASAANGYVTGRINAYFDPILTQ